MRALSCGDQRRSPDRRQALRLSLSLSSLPLSAESVDLTAASSAPTSRFHWLLCARYLSSSLDFGPFPIGPFFFLFLPRE